MSNLFKRETLSGDFLQVNTYLINDLKRLGLWTEEMRTRIKQADGSIQGIDEIPADLRTVYRTVWEIPQKALVDMAAERGPYIDQSQSLNLFIETPTIGKLSSMYAYAWKAGLKTTYYLRSRPATRIAQTTAGGDGGMSTRNNGGGSTGMAAAGGNGAAAASATTTSMDAATATQPVAAAMASSTASAPKPDAVLEHATTSTSAERIAAPSESSMTSTMVLAPGVSDSVAELASAGADRPDLRDIDLGDSLPGRHPDWPRPRRRSAIRSRDHRLLARESRVLRSLPVGSSPIASGSAAASP